MGLRDIFRKERDYSIYSEPIVREAATSSITPANSANPRTRTTGTTLSTQDKGSIPVDAGAYNEVGSSRGGITRERVPIFVSSALSIRQYDWMTASDAAVDVSLRAGKMPIMGAFFFVEQYDADPINMQIAEFVQYNLLHGTSAPFLLILEDILRMYEYGYSVLEKVYESREWVPTAKGANRRVYTMLKKLAPRPTPMIRQINYDDNGGPLGITYNALDSKNQVTEVDIPIEKLIIFSFNKKGGNLEGKSILRTAYQSWYFKSNLYNIDGIQKERHGMGFPVVKAPPGSKLAEIQAAKAMVQNIRTNEFGGIVLPPGFELDFADIKGQPVDVMKSIEHHNGQIMLNVMTQFLLLGIQTSGGGGRATAGSHQDVYTKSLRYVGNLICEYINLYLIPQLVAYNFDTDKFPKLQVKNIGETKDLQQWAAGLANLIARNAITVDLPFEQWVRGIVDAPLKEGTRQTPENNPGATPSAQKGNVSGNANPAAGGNTGVPVDQAAP